MFIVKLIKYAGHSSDAPSEVDTVSIREANAAHVRRTALLDALTDSPKLVLQLGDAPGETAEFSIGPTSDCSYEVAYVMNAQGKTVETIR
jgi:hypothetical protein